MIEIDGEQHVSGPLSEQPTLVRIGCFVAFGAFVIFGAYVPAALAVAVVAGVGTPAPSWHGTAAALGFTAAFAAIGAWANGRFLRWLRGGRLGAAAWCCFNAGCLTGSAAVAWAAVHLHEWPAVFIVAVATVFAGLIAAWILVEGSQASPRR